MQEDDVAAFPSESEWGVPASGWHADANYLSALSPPAGVRSHALFGDVVPRGGGTLFLSGSQPVSLTVNRCAASTKFGARHAESPPSSGSATLGLGNISTWNRVVVPSIR